VGQRGCGALPCGVRVRDDAAYRGTKDLRWPRRTEGCLVGLDGSLGDVSIRGRANNRRGRSPPSSCATLVAVRRAPRRSHSPPQQFGRCAIERSPESSSIPIVARPLTRQG
jgi:hypothetical protein